MQSTSVPTTPFKPFHKINREHIAVIGGGIIGLSTAYAAALCGRGKVAVTLYESLEVNHTGAASSDMNRVFRYLNGPDQVLTEWAIEASHAWNSMSVKSGRAIFRRSGVLFLLHKDPAIHHTGKQIWRYTDAGDWMEESLKNLNLAAIPHRRLTPKTLRRGFPQFEDGIIEEAILDENGGYLMADTALITLLDMCLAAGVTYKKLSPVRGVTAISNGSIIHLENGQDDRFDSVVVATNGWIRDLLPLDHKALTITEQPLIYLSPSNNQLEQLNLSSLPVFISLNTSTYGFPLHNGLMKVGDDNPYLQIDHPSLRQGPDQKYIKRTTAKIEKFLPSLRGAKVSKTHSCFYDRSSDERFILDSWDSQSRIIYGCGMSGRAFKFAPVIGERLARFAVSGDRPDDLASFAYRTA